MSDSPKAHALNHQNGHCCACHHEAHDDHDHGHDHAHQRHDSFLVSILPQTGFYLGAWLSKTLFPAQELLVFTLACLFLAAPFLKRVFQLVWSKNFFNIEVLMIVASVGAIFVGDAAEAATAIY